MRRVLRILPLLLIALGIVAVVTVLFLQRNTFHAFSALRGPTEASVIAPPQPAAWQAYARGETSRLALLLTDDTAAWPGLVSALKSMGVPFVVTDDVARATRHHVVLAYPMIAGSLLSGDELRALRAHVDRGGVLIATQVLGGGMQDLFGFESVTESRSHHSVAFSRDDPLTAWLDHPHEQTVLLGHPDDPASWPGTQVYHGAEQVLARFQDGGPALITRQAPGAGTTYALGFDPGFFILRAQNDRNQEAYRQYANGYEPSVDVWLRWLHFLYRRHEPLAATLNTVPAGQDLSVVVTLDVDYAHSMQNMAAYHALFDSHDIGATFFIQTKYFRDFQDQGFFNDASLSLLRALSEGGMEIGSHTVSHTDMYAEVPLGSGEEMFPDYQPRVRRSGDTRGATVLGEMRVSKYLLEHVIDTDVVSFRPGYLATPPSLPQALAATGYRYSSSVTAGNVTTHLPYRLMYDRRYSARTDIWEFPIAVEDEFPPEMDQRLDEALALAEQLARYGGSFVILVHPDVLDHKYRFLAQMIPALKGRAWFGTLREFGDWWRARDAVTVDMQRAGQQVLMRVNVPHVLDGLTLTLPSGLTPVAGLPVGAVVRNGQLLLPRVEGELRILLGPVG
ncbi:MAG: polysaccharide deacetylase family protein [Alcanivorax sp.]|nr:polysaccharide deacetylase family protein [Alcanivorax sp.]